MLAENIMKKWKIKVERTENALFKLEVKPWGILLSLPYGENYDAIYRILEKHADWIEQKHAELLSAIVRSKKIELEHRSRQELRAIVEKLVEKAAGDIAVSSKCRVVIRNMKTRWGSCSRKKIITINSLARYLPEHLVSFIVYHEMCHLIESKHNKAFQDCLQMFFPLSKELEKELLAYEIKLGLLSS